MATIHPTAQVDDSCILADDAVVGPWCVLSGNITLGKGVTLLGNNYISGPVSIGDNTQVYPFACIGYPAQDVKFKPGDITAGVVIGNDCIMREHVTIHAATDDHTPTRIGNNVFMMVHAHVAHDCVVGNGVTMVNGTAIGGHSIIGDNANLGGNAVVHQFVRIGRMVMMSGDCAVSQDVPPFCSVMERNRIGGINLVGLRRRGFDRQHITLIQRSYRDLLHRPLPRKTVIAEMRKRASAFDCPALEEMAEFIETSKRGIANGMGKPIRGMSSHTRERDAADLHAVIRDEPR